MGLVWKYMCITMNISPVLSYFMTRFMENKYNSLTLPIGVQNLLLEEKKHENWKPNGINHT